MEPEAFDSPRGKGSEPFDKDVPDLPADGPAAAAFALACVEELAPLAGSLCPDPAVGAQVRQAADLVRQALTTADVPARTAAETVRAALDARLGEDADFGRYHDYVDDAVAAAGYALDALLDGDRDAAANAALRVREVYLTFAAQAWRTLPFAELTALPIVTAVLERQRSVAEAVAHAGDGRLGAVLPGLLTTAATSGATLVDLITGDAAGRSPAASGDQETLF